tara:strand:- start:2925 stop:3377 length:453 start_codon:yes stop_codon:yes gene_type:complete
MYQQIQDLFKNMPREQLVLLSVVSLLVLGFILYMCKDCVQNKFRNMGLTGSEVETFQNNDMVFRMFYVNWCGHCKAAKPEFKKLLNKSPYKGKIKIEMIDSEENEENAKLAEESGVEGYPTIILMKNGEPVPYNGDRTYSAFVEFLDSHM